MYLFSAALGLRCRARAFSSCSQRLFSSSSTLASPCSGFCCCRVLDQDAGGLTICGTQTSLSNSMWVVPEPGMEPVSPALASKFLTIGPPWKSLK